MSQTVLISRRVFLKLSATAGAGLMAGISLLPSCTKDSKSPVKALHQVDPGLWVRIDSDNTVTVIISKAEMGQGILTSMAMLVAEELEADWSRLRTEWAPADRAYANPMFGIQVTSASTSMRTLWDPLRRAGAMLREMLIGAASEVWDVSKKTCRAENSFVVHTPSGRRLSYGMLAARATKRPFPQEVQLKDISDFKIIGRRMPGLDAYSKITGTATFGFDVSIPGMLVAAVSRCPVFGGIPDRFDASESLGIKGVRDVVEISNGIAIVADNYWAAVLGRDALDVTWDRGPNKNLDSVTITAMLENMLDCQGVPVFKRGDATSPPADAGRKIESIYQLPYLAHAPMEPLSCTARVDEKSCDLWVPTQNQTGAQQAAKLITGLPRSAIRVHTTFLGCGLGRGQFADHVTESVEISKAIGKPVKVMWTREDDIQHDHYRPATMHRLSASLNAEGWPVFWFHRIAGISDFFNVCLTAGADKFPYAIENVEIECVHKTRGKMRNLPRYIQNRLKGRHTYDGMWNSVKTPIPYVPTGPWRSIGHSHNAFVIESFVDELAAKAGIDPYLYRRNLLKNAPRELAVLDLAASKFGWGKPLKKGRYAGIAEHQACGSSVAQVAEISTDGKGMVRIHRVVCAIDCGTVINPDTVEAQMEGCIVFGLTAALKGEITISKGCVEQSNFHDYELLKMSEMPRIEVYIVPSREAPGGVGEVGVPTIAPAVTNALFSATGKRIRRLPVRLRAA